MPSRILCSLSWGFRSSATPGLRWEVPLSSITVMDVKLGAIQRAAAYRCGQDVIDVEVQVVCSGVLCDLQARRWAFGKAV